MALNGLPTYRLIESCDTATSRIKEIRDEEDGPKRNDVTPLDISNNPKIDNGETGPKIAVIARVRPSNNDSISDAHNWKFEFSKDRPKVPIGIAIDFNSSSTLSTASIYKKVFALDRVYDMYATQEEIYNESISSLIDDLLNGYNVTVLAYGQTGSGKTYTMLGNDPIDGVGGGEDRGIFTRIIEYIFEWVETKQDGEEFELFMSACEIYLERILDLLIENNKKMNLKIRGDVNNGVYVENLHERMISSKEAALALLLRSQMSRAVGVTNMNQRSSRSHLVFFVRIVKLNQATNIRTGSKLTLVDLAGSEKISKTGAEGLSLEEAKVINKSLSALGNVVNALSLNRENAHIPFRDSQLTRILQDSLGGNSKTVLICTLAMSHMEETISTLRFGQRARNIVMRPEVNRVFDFDDLRKLVDKLNISLEVQKKYSSVLEECLVSANVNIPPFPTSTKNEINMESVNDFTSKIKTHEKLEVDEEPNPYEKPRVEGKRQINFSDHYIRETRISTYDSQCRIPYFVEEQINSLTDLYYDLVHEHTVLEGEVKMKELRLQRRDAEIRLLEEELRESRCDYERLIVRCRHLFTNDSGEH